MNLDAIIIQARPGEQESLGLAVRAVARAAGADLDYDELCAALGISLTAVAGPADGSPPTWLTCARDAFLAPTARLFGMQIRDLHPPDVGVDMLHAEEFPQHFDLSYKPLIRRALENSQPVLAWSAWTPTAAPWWGVITAWNAEGPLGAVPGIADRVPLVGPALQCYVVEQHERRVPTPDEVLATAIAHADAYLSCPEHLPGRSRYTATGVVTGPPAYDVWARWLENQRPGGGEDPAREDHRLYTCFLCAARLSAIRFLQRSNAVQGPDHAAVLDSIIDACEELLRDISPFCRPEEVSAFWNTAEGHQELLEAIRAAQAADRQIAAYIHHLAQAL